MIWYVDKKTIFFLFWKKPPRVFHTQKPAVRFLIGNRVWKPMLGQFLSRFGFEKKELVVFFVPKEKFSFLEKFKILLKIRRDEIKLYRNQT